MIPIPMIPESAYTFVWAGLILMAIVALLAGYRKWQSESAVVVLSSKEYKDDRAALLDTVKKAIADEAAQTRELVTTKVDYLGRSLDRVERNSASREDVAVLKGHIRSLETLNHVLHGIHRSSDSASVERVS